jgi:hypothetical protein
VAQAMTITSGQPTIVDNEKGLLVSFKIIGTQVGSNSMHPSLVVNFGDIEPQSTVVARWLLTSSLQVSNKTFKIINILTLGNFHII